jgi:hypothetical protein
MQNGTDTDFGTAMSHLNPNSQFHCTYLPVVGVAMFTSNIRKSRGIIYIRKIFKKSGFKEE